MSVEFVTPAEFVSEEYGQKGLKIEISDGQYQIVIELEPPSDEHSPYTVKEAMFSTRSKNFTLQERSLSPQLWEEDDFFNQVYYEPSQDKRTFVLKIAGRLFEFDTVDAAVTAEFKKVMEMGIATFSGSFQSTLQGMIRTKPRTDICVSEDVCTLSPDDCLTVMQLKKMKFKQRTFKGRTALCYTLPKAFVPLPRFRKVASQLVTQAVFKHDPGAFSSAPVQHYEIRSFKNNRGVEYNLDLVLTNAERQQIDDAEWKAFITRGTVVIASPTTNPTANPTAHPTAYPTANPTAFPTANPTAFPTAHPTTYSTAIPTTDPTGSPVLAKAAEKNANKLSSLAIGLIIGGSAIFLLLALFLVTKYVRKKNKVPTQMETNIASSVETNGKESKQELDDDVC